ncbi:MAG: type II secretion system protein [Candidatus Taylorbacteria bacterium]
MRNATNTRGFTLLEILLVVAIISILAGIVIVAINPAKQLGDARNAQRRADVSTILSAVYQYVIDNNGTVPAAVATNASNYVSASTTCAAIKLVDADEICKSNATSCTGYSALGNFLATSTSGGVSYVTSMPTDPSATSTGAGTGYYIAKLTASNNRILVCAPLTENITSGGTVDGAIGVAR